MTDTTDGFPFKDAILGLRYAATKVIAGFHFRKQIQYDSAGNEVIGTKTDAKATNTDTTSVSAMSVWKQISASVQTLAGAVAASKAAVTIADGDAATLGLKTDAKATNTDTTSVSAMSVWKQISASVQSLFTLHGAATDAKASQTDATSLTFMQVLKQISASVQTFAGNNVDVIGPDATFTLPSGTTYASGELVANSGTAGSVTAFAFTVTAAKFSIVGGRIKKTSLTTSAASFRMHLYSADPTTSTGIVNGDNAAFSTKVGSYIGAIDINVDQAFSDASFGRGVPRIGNSIPINIASGLKVYGLLESRDAYAPTNGETITPSLEVVY